VKANVLARIHDRIKETVKKNDPKTWIRDPQERIAEMIWIRTKEKKVINLIFNPIQVVYWSERTKRDIILKPRQLGFSTQILAEFFDDTINTPNTNTVIIAHDSDSTRKLFNVVQFMYNNLPEEKKIELNGGKKRPKYGNRKEFYFESINSRITVGTAGSTDFGRGDTINNLHCSEVAFWPNPEELMTGLLQAVPFDGRIVIETTANGVGNYFYRTYYEAKEGKSRWKPHFYRWFDHPEYRLQLDQSEVISYTEEETNLIEAHQLSPEQIKWRRWKISEIPEKDGISKEDRFKQEYPEDDMSCFLNSGNPVFHIQTLAKWRKQLETKPTPCAEYTVDEYGPQDDAIHSQSSAELVVYKEPEWHKRYIVAADTAQGKEDGDYDATHILDYETLEQVAVLHGKWDPDIYGRKLVRVATYYNQAILGIERNNHGHSVLNTVINYERYGNVYYHVEYDDREQEEKKEPGFPTTKKTKPIMISDLQHAIREELVPIHHLKTVDELMSFVRKEGGKMEAQQGSYDDLVMAFAIGLQIHKLMPVPLSQGTRSGRIRDSAKEEW
jgi:hypothetical protein